MRIRRDVLILLLAVVLLPVAAAYVQWAAFGLPQVTASPVAAPGAAPSGFPAWLRITHYVNFCLSSCSSAAACKSSWSTHGCTGTSTALPTPSGSA